MYSVFCEFISNIVPFFVFFSKCKDKIAFASGFYSFVRYLALTGKVLNATAKWKKRVTKRTKIKPSKIQVFLHWFANANDGDKTGI